MTVDVSVVIPMFNTGADIDECLLSMANQTLPADRFEVVVVDDGSTDGSGARVDRWAARYPDLITVHHIAATGGPAHPRNVGIDRSRGRFIQFVDSDDTLAPRALERLLEVADGSSADIVVSKISAGGPRGVYHPLFRQTVTHRTFADCLPLIRNGTVCKMFRREFLLAHDIRFPEGPNRMEDQHLCVRTYAHAESIAVVADLVCYFHWRRRTGGRHFGDAAVVPADYERELGTILDLIDAEVAPAGARLAAQRRYYRGPLLGHLRGRGMMGYDEGYRRELTTVMRRLAGSRFSAEVRDTMPAFLRTQSALLLDDDVDGLCDYARRLESLVLMATTTTPQWRDGSLVITVDAELRLDDQPLRLERDGAAWALPAALAPTVSVGDRRLTADDDDDLDIDLAAISRLDSSLWSNTEGLSIGVGDDGAVRFGGEVTLDPSRVMGGAPLTAGPWDLRLRVMFAGLTFTSGLRRAASDSADAATWINRAALEPQSITPHWTDRASALALDVNAWIHPLGDQDLAELRIEGSRDLVVTAPGWRGHDGTSHPAELTLEPLDVPDGRAVTCPAQIRLGADGSSLRAAIPALAATARRWTVWLRVGELGGAPPRQLPVELTEDGRGELTVTAGQLVSG
jgi:glycosyltransferase involved in cell wall biosynthesis